MKSIDLIIPYPIEDYEFANTMAQLEVWCIYPMAVILDYLFDPDERKTDLYHLKDTLRNYIGSEIEQQLDCATIYDHETGQLVAESEEDAELVQRLTELVYGDNTLTFEVGIMALANHLIEHYGYIDVSHSRMEFNPYSEDITFEFEPGPIPGYVVLKLTDVDNIKELTDYISIKKGV